MLFDHLNRNQQAQLSFEDLSGDEFLIKSIGPHALVMVARNDQLAETMIDWFVTNVLDKEPNVEIVNLNVKHKCTSN